MLIAVLATDEQWNEMMAGANEQQFFRAQSFPQAGADAYILLQHPGIGELPALNKPVLLGAVTDTLKEINAGPHVCRINGWPTFLQRKLWEVAGESTNALKDIFLALGRQYIQAADEPGLVAARPIAMIINEAYFALGEGVSTKAEIDVAMKLGTNYPLGPFEWAEKIGVKNIYQLLVKLGNTDKRYLPAPLLTKEAIA